MARLKVDTDSMQSLAKSMTEWIAETAQTLTQMRELVASLDATWEGGNHDTFVESFEKRIENVRAQRLTIEKFAESLEAASKLYMELETEVAEEVAKL